MAFQIRRLFLGFAGFPWADGGLIDADPTFLYNYVGEVPVVFISILYTWLQVAMNLFY